MCSLKWVLGDNEQLKHQTCDSEDSIAQDKEDPKDFYVNKLRVNSGGMLRDTNYGKRPGTGLWWASASLISEGLALCPLPTHCMPGGCKSLLQMSIHYLKRSQRAWEELKRVSQENESTL